MSRVDSAILSLIEWLNGSKSGGEVGGNFSRCYVSAKLTVQEFEGSGRGLRADVDVARNETIIRIPQSFLLNKTSVIWHISRFNRDIQLSGEPYFHGFSNVIEDSRGVDRSTEVYSRLSLADLEEISAFQLVSLYLCLERSRGSLSWWKPFLDTLPTMDDFGMNPLIWRVLQVDGYQSLLLKLPGPVKKHADKVYGRFMEDYNTVRDLVSRVLRDTGTPGDESVDRDSEVQELVSIDTFLYCWMCINSRCLYMDIPHSKTKADSFTMAPYVDFLNHSCEDLCGIKVSNNCFIVYAMRPFAAGEQLFLSYGPHSNNFLLCEYGFTLAQNKWNDMDITDYVMPLLDESQREFLTKHDYLGDYTISLELGLSFRAEVALAALQEQYPRESTKLLSLINGYSEGEAYRKGSKHLAKTILEVVIKDCDKHLHTLSSDSSPASSPEAEARNEAIKGLYRDRKTIASHTLPNL